MLGLYVSNGPVMPRAISARQDVTTGLNTASRSTSPSGPSMQHGASNLTGLRGLRCSDVWLGKILRQRGLLIIPGEADALGSPIAVRPPCQRGLALGCRP